LGHGQVDGRLERDLEVVLALVDPLRRDEREIGPSEVGVAEGRDLHRVLNPPTPTRWPALLPCGRAGDHRTARRRRRDAPWPAPRTAPPGWQPDTPLASGSGSRDRG